MYINLELFGEAKNLKKSKSHHHYVSDPKVRKNRQIFYLLQMANDLSALLGENIAYIAAGTSFLIHKLEVGSSPHLYTIQFSTDEKATSYFRCSGFTSPVLPLNLQ